MDGSKKLVSCLVFIDIILCLAGALLCGVCIFVAVTTYDFQSVVTEKLWNSLIGLGSLGAFTVITGLVGFVIACCYQKKGTVLFNVFLIVAIIGTCATGIFFYVEQLEVSNDLEINFNETSQDIKQTISNRLNCDLYDDLSASDDDDLSVLDDNNYCPVVLDNYFNNFAISITAGTGFLLLLQALELLLSLTFGRSLTRNQNVRIIPVQPSEMYGNWWVEGGTGGSFYFRHTRQSNPQHY